MDASLAFAVELEQRDEEAAAKLDVLARLARQVDDVRERVERVAAFRERLPADRGHLEASIAEVERDLDAARSSLARAGEDLERARSEDGRTRARRHVAHAASDVRTTEERRVRLVARAESLTRETTDAEAEAAAVAAAAQGLSVELSTAPRVAAAGAPGPGLEGALEWVSRAQAAVFVARSGLETERERVVREANELAASVLGEPLYATRVATVRERLEQRLA